MKNPPGRINFITSETISLIGSNGIYSNWLIEHTTPNCFFGNFLISLYVRKRLVPKNLVKFALVAFAIGLSSAIQYKGSHANIFCVNVPSRGFISTPGYFHSAYLLS